MIPTWREDASTSAVLGLLRQAAGGLLQLTGDGTRLEGREEQDRVLGVEHELDL